MTYEQMHRVLDELERGHNLRSLPTFSHHGKYAIKDGRKMLNLSSNDYLGLATQDTLKEEFLNSRNLKDLQWSASSSRLLTGNFRAHQELENLIADMFHKEAALIFNSGFHANSGIIAALADRHTLILADKLVHASIIDGIHLSGATCIRYRHNQYEQLESLLEKYHSQFDNIFIITESVYSMDGDKADIKRLCSLKMKYEKVYLYVDEAHAFGVFGRTGLGCCEEADCLDSVDILVGTFGKAIASEGAFIVCRKVVKDFLVNTMRPFIFTTALPPINVEWTTFIVQRLTEFDSYRKHLKNISVQLQETLKELGYGCNSSSGIIPLIVGDSKKCILLAETLQHEGFYVLPVRPPTVPQGSSRIRFSLTAAITQEEIKHLTKTLRRVI